MKKFLTMCLVLALCSLASATTCDIYITDTSGNSAITLNPSNYVDLIIWGANSSDIRSFDVDLIPTGKATLSTFVITAAPRVTDYDGIVDDMTKDPAYVGTEVTATNDGSSGYALGMGTANKWATLKLHCDGTGTVTLALTDLATLDGNWDVVTTTVHGMTIHQVPVPEPMTVALLGLGGLFLRRRK